jgi:hypothetical protein
LESAQRLAIGERRDAALPDDVEARRAGDVRVDGDLLVRIGVDFDAACCIRTRR